MRTLNINYFFPIEPKSGVKSRWPGTFVSSQVLMLKNQGILTEVISPSPWIPSLFRQISSFQGFIPPDINSQFFGIKVVRRPFLNLPERFRKGFFGKYYKKMLNKVIIKSLNDLQNPEKIDIIHSHFGNWATYSLGLKNILNVPLVVTFYGHDVTMLPKIDSNIYANLISANPTCLAISSDMKKDLLQLGFSDVRVWHLGVDLDFFKPKENNKKSFKSFLIISRFEEKKGIEYAIEAFSIVAEKFPDATMNIVGWGSLEKKYKSMVSSMNLKSKINFMNNMDYENPREKVLELLQEADVFVHPSVIAKNGDKEGTPVILMEAQACKLPCISTFHAGIPEVVLDKKTGWLVPEKNTNALAKKMFSALSDTKNLTYFGNEARKHINKNFNIKLQIPKLREIYRGLVK